MKPNEKKIMIVGVGALAAIGIYFATRGNNEMVYEEIPNQIPTTTPQPTPIVLDGNKLLKKGVNGSETKKLQTLLGITSDGIFGTQTEAALLAKKGVVQTTLNQFPTLLNINQNPIAIGSRVMADVKTGTPIFSALQKADGSYYSDYKILYYHDYGKEIGIVKSHNDTKTWYLVEYTGFLGSKQFYFVKSSDLAKI